MLKTALAKLTAHHPLGREETRACIDAMLQPDVSPALVAAWLVALRMKGETVEEIAGVVEALRSRALRVTVADHDAIDTCGTGGDGAHTFNVSTAVAFVVAGANVTVAKHGNRAVSSRSGSADVLSALGVGLEPQIDVVERCIAEERIGFLFAQRHHPALRFVGPVRKELGIRTIFNLAAPLANPAGVKRQLAGVYDGRLVETLAATLGALGSVRAWIVHGAGGLDELSLAGESRVAEWHEGSLRTFTVVPEDAGLPRAPVEALAGGDAGENALLLKRLLSGEKGAHRDAVVFNAAAALIVAGKAGDLREGAAMAAHAIDSGSAQARLDALVRRTGAV